MQLPHFGKDVGFLYITVLPCNAVTRHEYIVTVKFFAILTCITAISWMAHRFNKLYLECCYYIQYLKFAQLLHFHFP
jgi:hypothetical protein